MKNTLILVTLGICGLLTARSAQAVDNLLQNGSFADTENPLNGWVTDYAWSKNSHYEDNKTRVSVVPKEAGRINVCRIASTRDSGTKLETTPIPFEEGYRYRCTLKFKGPDYRIYFAGYKWKPGVQPHDKPELPELRSVYKSRAETFQSSPKKPSAWKTVTLELPGKKMTPGMKSYMKQIKYITLYTYVIRTGFIDEVVISRKKDPSVKFD